MRGSTRKKPFDDGWSGPGSQRQRFSWRTVLWLLLFPQAGQRTGLTLSGLLLIALSMAIGMAAYNSASNILFLALSLLLACLVLSGVLSWLNFRGLRWKLDVGGPMRAGQDHAIALRLRNTKWFLPSYGLWFEIDLAESQVSREVALRGRLDAGAETTLECVLRPARRGRDRVRLTYIGSYFPFGFLRKTMTVGFAQEVVVWPAPVEYRRFAVDSRPSIRAEDTARRPGEGGDLLALRRYQPDDSHRQIHWKASARLRQLMVRQTAAEAGQAFSLWVDLSADLWPRPEQFELLCSFAATLAEDLFKAGKLRAVGVGAAPLWPVRRLTDVEGFFDRLAAAAPEPMAARRVPAGARLERVDSANSELLPDVRGPVSAQRNLITFAPDGPRGVAAYLHGARTAAA